MRGPVNFTTNDVVGLLVDGFDDDPSIMMPYNHAYYDGLFEAAGFTKAKDLFAFEPDRVQLQRARSTSWPASSRRAAASRSGPSTWGAARRSSSSCATATTLAWAKNWGFVPWTDRELDFIAKELKPLGGLPLRLRRRGGREARRASSITIPDANQALKLARGRLFPFGLLKILWKLKVQKCTRLRTIAMGVLPEHRRRGIEAILIHRLVRNSAPWVTQAPRWAGSWRTTKPLLGMLRRIGAGRTKTYRVYDRPV